MHTGSNGFVNYNTHAQAVHAIVAINGQMVGDKALECGWGRLQPRQSCTPAWETLQMQHSLGYMWPHNFMNAVLGMPVGPGRQPELWLSSILLPQHAPQLLPVGAPTTAQHQMLAGQGVYTNQNHLYVCGSMYNATQRQSMHNSREHAV